MTTPASWAPSASISEETVPVPVVIVHNHPIHYKRLLFNALARQGLDFTVLYTAAASKVRAGIGMQAPAYDFRVGYEGQYECHRKLPTARYVWSALSELQPNAVIISGYYDVAAWAAWCWAVSHRRRRIVWAESNYFDARRNWFKERLKRVFVSHCDAAHVYGRTNAEYIESLGMPRRRIVLKRAVADIGFLTQSSRERTAPDGAKTLLFVGRFAPEKNLRFLVQAFLSLLSAQPDLPARLVLVGYGPEENLLRELASRSPHGEKVEFWGKVAQSQLPAVYSRADVLVLPSVREPWGLVALEAMACGLPVIASDRCGCAQDLVTPRTGWVFSIDAAEQLQAIIAEVVATPREQLQRMGKAAAEMAMEYTPELCAKRVIASLTDLGIPVRVA